ncbi:Hsp20 family protein [Cytobacillus spongiae]|jgi:HSP20 family protein|nr:Hsp20 family protein [Cytobacillus spongiae]UII57944.1 Hsp20 family protein [Cytobacillus spongiae]
MSSKPPKDDHQQKRNRNEPFGEIMKSMNHFFNERPVKGLLQNIDDFFQSPFPATPSFRVNHVEKDHEHIITAELPGIKKDQIHIDILNHTLSITVQHQESVFEEDQAQKMYRKQQHIQKMSRSIMLSHPIPEKQVKASYRDGLLQIKVPKPKGKTVIIDAE